MGAKSRRVCGRSLQEVLEKSNQDLKICIGARSSFMYFGTVADAREEVPKIFEDVRKNLEKRADEGHKNLIALAARPIKKRRGEEDDDFERRLRAYITEINENRNKLVDYSIYNSKYKDVMKRAVKKVYRRDTDDYIAIIITGSEQGDYWCIQDWENAHKETN